MGCINDLKEMLDDIDLIECGPGVHAGVEGHRKAMDVDGCPADVVDLGNLQSL